MRKFIEDKYIRMGFMLFTVGAGLILFYLVLGHLSGITGFFGNVIDILKPFIFGMVIAYLLCPIYNYVTRRCYHNLRGKISNQKAFFWAKIMATTISLVLFFLTITAVLMLIIPQLLDSIVSLIQTTPGRVQDLIAWIHSLTDDSENPIEKMITQGLSNASDYMYEYAKSKVLPGINGYIGMVSQGVIATLKTVLNLVLGIIVAVYTLNSKEKFKAQAEKMVHAFCNRGTAQEIFEFGNFTDRTFGGFINGKIIDSIIIGILCFIVMTIFNWPYAALCSTIIGVTNIIPFFGPFIGAVPTALIICVVSPIQALEFLVWIFVLQQFDGNILGPKILGDSTGLASFWVMFAIILFGGLFGFVGMVVGVPVFAVFYYYVKRYIEKKLRRKNLPTETNEYKDFNKYDIDRKEIL